MHAVVIGANGLTGRALCQELELNRDIHSFRMLVRSSIDQQYSKGIAKTIDFNQLQDYAPLFQADVLFCCLGTTMAKAGSRSAFAAIDYNIPLECAKLAKQGGVKKLILVSSVGANAQSPNFYLRTKGMLERSIADLGFESLHIFRPGLLLGKRQETRRLETFFQWIMPIIHPLLIGPLQQYKGIHVNRLAHSMANASLSQFRGIKTYTYKEIIESI